MSELFPIFLKLQGRKCLVVGGGPIAAQKMHALLLGGASVTVVAPAACEVVRARIDAGEVLWKERGFEPSDLTGVMLVVAATGDHGVNEQVFRAADTLGILCNAADEPERCHFHYPAVVRRGDLQIAISTNGRSPALAQQIRKELEERYDESYAEWVHWLGNVRSLYFRLEIAAERRVRALHRIASRNVYERYRALRQHQLREAQRG